jgi:hypothetical protein
MSALIKVLTTEQYGLLSDILGEEGLILVSPDTAKSIAAELGISVDEINQQYIDDYTFGGEADHWVELVVSNDHYCMEAIRERFTE